MDEIAVEKVSPSRDQDYPCRARRTYPLTEYDSRDDDGQQRSEGQERNGERKFSSAYSREEKVVGDYLEREHHRDKRSQLPGERPYVQFEKEGKKNRTPCCQQNRAGEPFVGFLHDAFGHRVAAGRKEGAREGQQEPVHLNTQVRGLPMMLVFSLIFSCVPAT